MNDLFGFFLAVILAIILGILAGVIISGGAISNDCSKLGAFRHCDKVFKCEEVKK